MIIEVYDKTGSLLWDRKVGRQKTGASTNLIGKALVSADGKYIAVGTVYGEMIFFDTLIPPTVNSGADQYVSAGDNASFSGSALDDHSNIVKYEWDFDGDGTYDFASTQTGITEHTYDEAGTYKAQFKATNEEGAASIDTITVYVSEKSGDDIDEAGSLLILGAVIFCVIIFRAF